jgi:hypothetical protein
MILQCSVQCSVVDGRWVILATYQPTGEYAAILWGKGQTEYVHVFVNAPSAVPEKSDVLGLL